MENRRMFDRYVGIDYSGANTPVARLNGLAVYLADRDGAPGIVLPHKDDCDLWSRKLIAQWLVELLSDRTRKTLVGIDHGFGFPVRYFAEDDQIRSDSWEHFLIDHRQRWPTHEDDAWVSDIFDGPRATRAQDGNHKWFRMTDERGEVPSITVALELGRIGS